MSCLYACAYVWAGVCGCVWLRLIRSSWESSPLGYISSCHALPLVRSLQFAVDVYEAFLVPGFRDSWALLLSWTPIAGDSSAHCFPALPASAPTESSASAYGKLRFCLRKAPPLPYGSSASALRKAPFSFSLCITSCNKLSFSATESSRLHCDKCTSMRPRLKIKLSHIPLLQSVKISTWPSELLNWTETLHLLETHRQSRIYTQSLDFSLFVISRFSNIYQLCGKFNSLFTICIRDERNRQFRYYIALKKNSPSKNKHYHHFFTLMSFKSNLNFFLLWTTEYNVMVVYIAKQSASHFRHWV